MGKSLRIQTIKVNSGRKTAAEGHQGRDYQTRARSYRAVGRTEALGIYSNCAEKPGTRF